uniref:Putative ixodes 10 kDa peptide protein n=1 Tax=Ixodes ricinus TaxID=34613 RepID=A0A0K8RLL1_IXORI
MYRNISIMLFVLFAVVVCLPASKEEGFSSDVDKCYLALMNKKGDIYCELCGYDTFKSLVFGKCEVVCGDSEVQLPREACPSGSMQNPCTEDELDNLKKWANGLEDKREKIKGKLCSP